MRIAYVVDEFPSPSQTFVLNQINGLIGHGHGVDIYAMRRGEGELSDTAGARGFEDRTVHLSRVPPGMGARLKTAFHLASAHPERFAMIASTLNPIRFGRLALSLRLLHWAAPLIGRPQHYDLIHAHFGPNGIKADMLRRIGVLSGPLVTTFHGYDMTCFVDRHGTSVYHRLFRRGDLFLPISERWRQRLERLGCPREKIAVHRMGIDTARFRYIERDGNRAVFRLVSVARLVEKKGIEYGIRALARLKHEREFIYDIIGDGPLRQGLEGLVDELGLTGRVRLHGRKDNTEVAAVLEEADVLLAPSVTASDGDQEGIPVALMEAMAMGVPVISTRHSGIPELVEDGVSGLLAPERDEEALADRIATLADAPERRREIARAARAKVEREYCVHRLNERLIGHFERVASRSEPGMPGSRT